jgi:hypothetical protein
MVRLLKADQQIAKSHSGLVPGDLLSTPWQNSRANLIPDLNRRKIGDLGDAARSEPGASLPKRSFRSQAFVSGNIPLLEDELSKGGSH